MIDAVGHGGPRLAGGARSAQTFVGLLPDALAAKLMEKAGVDRLAALTWPSTSSGAVARSRSVGVYGGMTDPMPMLQMFDKQLTVRMGQANVSGWIDDLMPL